MPVDTELLSLGKLSVIPSRTPQGLLLNIVIKLMAVESLVFAPLFATHGGILFKWL